jgi:hypothetical protein
MTYDQFETAKNYLKVADDIKEHPIVGTIVEWLRDSTLKCQNASKFEDYVIEATAAIWEKSLELSVFFSDETNLEQFEKHVQDVEKYGDDVFHVFIKEMQFCMRLYLKIRSECFSTDGNSRWN